MSSQQFTIPAKWPEHKTVNGEKQLCCCLCSIEENKYIYKTLGNFKIFRGKGALVTKERESFIINLFPNIKPNDVLGSRLCDNHYRQVLAKQNEKKGKTNLNNANGKKKPSQKRNRLSQQQTSITQEEKRVKYISDDSGDDSSSASDNDDREIITRNKITSPTSSCYSSSSPTSTSGELPIKMKMKMKFKQEIKQEDNKLIENICL
ncbi:hypothetical protein ABK040_002380 [Willaertia magna]